MTTRDVVNTVKFLAIRALLDLHRSYVALWRSKYQKFEQLGRPYIEYCDSQQGPSGRTAFSGGSATGHAKRFTKARGILLSKPITRLGSSLEELVLSQASRVAQQRSNELKKELRLMTG